MVLLINDGKSSATGFPSVTLRANGDFVLPEKVDKFGRQGSRVLDDNIYYNTKEIIGGHGRSHHHSLQPGNVGRILSEIPSGPDPIHNPDSPSARVYVPLRANGDFVLPEKVDKFGRQGSRVLADIIYYNTKEIIGGHGRSQHHSLQPGNVGRILSEIPSGPDPIHNPDSPTARVYG
ncbi:hypothetical protein KIW84_032638 [Lathyrus oleraceus]|uniref:Uncharacterized protein n=1 Tax=Pisum sativum TaxID=3888 RepID=A0A9D5B1Z3_PEA|nr:hypothetical protein KIW84_032638 [Pisum sativum]